MRCFILITLVLHISSTSGWTQTIQKNRRIEEIKRGELAPPVVEVYKDTLLDQADISIDSSYYEQMLTREYALNADMAKVIMVLEGVDQTFENFAQQKEYMIEQGIINTTIASRFEAGEPITKGLAAYILVHTLGIKGGVSLRLFRFSQRYALRELIYKNMMVPGNVRDLLTTEELVYILTQAANYLAEKGQP